MTEDNCPECGEALEFDEVDIGVGVMRGNPGCPNCHWTPPIDPRAEEWERVAERESDAQLAAWDAHPDKDDDA